MNTEKQYIQAFNNGYILAQYEPKLLNTISKNLTPTSNYLQGFFGGRRQFELENSKNQIFELRQLRNNSQNKDKYFENER